jgi:hypothetical protein
MKEIGEGEMGGGLCNIYAPLPLGVGSGLALLSELGFGGFD